MTSLPPVELYPPEECVELSKFGVGPFPSGLPVICPPVFPASGYGGSLFPPYEIEGGFGGYIYGINPYGGAALPRVPIQVGAGYGGYPYGLGSYGGVSLPPPPFPAVQDGYGGISYGYSCYGVCKLEAPYLTGAVSLSATEIEIFFSKQMDKDSGLLDPLSYTLTPVLGAAPSSAVSVVVGVEGPVGATSVILTHTGTTIGGVYDVTVVGPTDITGDSVEDSGRNTTSLLTRGRVPYYTATVLSDSSLLMDFSEGLVEEGTFPGIAVPSSYEISSSYPVAVTVNSVEHPYLLDNSKIALEVQGLTTTDYNCTITPALAILYDGSYLPDSATEFIGVELGTGASASLHNWLLLSSSFASYGWAFEDTSGKIAPNRSFRVDFKFDVLRATFNPPLFDAVLGALHFNDGGVQFSIYIERVTGTDILTMVSGGFTSSVNANWSTEESTISVLRNQLADTYALLYNETPLLTVPTASLTGVPVINEGAQFLLSPNYEVTDFRIHSLLVTSSNTIFSLAWNFIHQQIQILSAFSSQTKDTVLTRNGPLVKGWGDATPATKEDVEVRVNGTAVEIDSVNPYIGEIKTKIPIPLLPAGSISVEVDYKWFPTPVMEMVGLNTPGLVLNKYDIGANRNSSTLNPIGDGGYDQSRFPFAVVLGPISRRTPKYIGHRYLGFEKEYTASLNSPTTLLLNQNPHAISVERFEEEVFPVSFAYEGTEIPGQGTPPWELEGLDSGSLVGDGTYTVIDATSGGYGVGYPAFYYRNEEITFPSSVNIATRFIINSFIPEGVFSGVAFGFHNNRNLFLVGAIEINGVKHIGLLNDLASPEEQESWIIGLSREIEITSNVTFTIPSDQTPVSLEPGDRFQILEGSQAGVYSISSVVFQTECVDGGNVTTITIDSSSPFSSDWTKYGENTPTIYFEVLWLGNPFTYRLVSLPEEGTAQLYIAGEISGLALEATGSPEVAMPSQACFTFSTDGQGQVFWGSTSRDALNSSTWSFFRYGITPDQRFYQAHDIIVSSEMEELPEEDTGSEWFVREGFGYAQVITGSQLLLKNLASDSSPELSFGYSRIEPFLDNKTNSDIDAKFRVERESLGFGDLQIVVRDGLREARLATLIYHEGVSSRQLVTMPSVSLPGLYLPSDKWNIQPGNTLTSTSLDCTLTLEQELGDSGLWSADLDITSFVVADEGSRDFECLLRVASSTWGLSGIAGPVFGGNTYSSGQKTIWLVLTRDGAMLTSDGITPVQEFSIEWDDQKFHSYRILIDGVASIVSFLFDEELQLPVVNLGSFSDSGIGSSSTVFFGHTGADVLSSSDWRAISGLFKTSDPSIMRTLGFYLGGDKEDINSWAIPRLDDDPVLNSDLTALVEEMDWTSEVEVRIHRDVEWGVTLLRPDLILPPWHTGDFATRITEPDAAWISVEYANLPRISTTFGSISWGALESLSLTTQRWDYLRYRLYTHFNDDYRSPHHMVLNQFNTISSGELVKDRTPESIEVTSLSSTLISLKPAHINAKVIFKVIEGTYIHPFETWTFDKESQTIFLDTPLSGEQVPVTVVFSPGKPVTNTYLEDQPLLDSITLLNEGTPPVPKNQEAEILPLVEFGSRINDPNDTLNSDPDFILNDPYRYVDFSSTENMLYEGMQFLEVDNGGQTGLISSICDISFSGHGLLEISVEGGYFSETNSAVLNKRTADIVYPYSDFIMGGSHATPSLIGSSNLLPLGPLSAGMSALNMLSPFNCQTQMVLILGGTIFVSPGVEEPLIEDASIAATADNVPPSYSTDYSIMPDGVPGSGYGACLGVMEEFVPTTKIGPWGGLSSLAPASLLYGVSAEQPWGVPASGSGFIMNPTPTPSTITIHNITI